MARIRSIKPEFYRHERLQELEKENPGSYPMLVFSGLWGHCDKQGVFEWRPKLLALDIVPFLWEGNIGEALGKTLCLLAENNLIIQMSHAGKEYGYIPSYNDHQRITGKEAQDPAKYPQLAEMMEVSDNGNSGETAGKQRGNSGETAGTTGREGKGIGREEIFVGGGSGKTPRATPPPPISPEVDEEIEAEVVRIKALHLEVCGLSTVPPLAMVREILQRGVPPSAIDDVYQEHGGDVPKYRQRNIVERLKALRDGKERDPPSSQPRGGNPQRKRLREELAEIWAGGEGDDAARTGADGVGEEDGSFGIWPALPP